MSIIAMDGRLGTYAVTFEQIGSQGSAASDE
jgi:hypothetical protein